VSQYGPQDDRPYPQQPPQPYGQQYVPQQPYAAPPGRPPTSHGKRPSVHPTAIAGLFLGCVALICAVTPLTIIGSIFGLVATGLAVIGLIRSASKGMAVAALVVAILAIPVGAGHWLIVQASQPTTEEVADCISKPDLTADEIWACAQ
jgi:hypothetical protein